MDKIIVNINENIVAIIKSDDLIITDSQSAIDLLAEIFYNDNCQRIVICKKNIIEDFFKLSTGIAGEILQKFISFKTKLAIVGDFSIYSSKSLKDFIYECNRGNEIFFVGNQQEALEKLTVAL